MWLFLICVCAIVNSVVDDIHNDDSVDSHVVVFLEFVVVIVYA